MNSDHENDVEQMERRGTDVHHESLRQLRIPHYAGDVFDVSDRLTSVWEPFQGCDRLAGRGMKWTKKT
jgi:hypothetical protein